MSSLAKIIYEETGIKQSSEPDEYEEIASACRRFALHCDPRQPLTDEQIKAIHATINWHEMGSAIAFARAIERANGIGGEA